MKEIEKGKKKVEKRNQGKAAPWWKFAARGSEEKEKKRGKRKMKKHTREQVKIW